MKPQQTISIQHAAHRRSWRLLKFRVFRISFLYLCFFIFNLRCLLTLIACHCSRYRWSHLFSQVSCLARMRSRKGSCMALPSSDSLSSSAATPSGIGACSTPNETAGVENRCAPWFSYEESIGIGAGGALKGRNVLASSSRLMLLCEEPISNPVWPPPAPSSCFTTDESVYMTSWALLLCMRGVKIASNDFWLSWAGMG